MRTEPQLTPSTELSSSASAPEDPSSIALATEDQHAPLDRSELPACRETFALVRIETENHQLSTTNHQLIPARHKARRKGRVAALPKLQRDMVNRMISNGVPYKNIVAALDDAGFNATERNISNWATGGYLEWRCEQDLVLQNRLDQDHLVDHLRRDDASELPEVGLQAAATRLSQILLQKTACADDVEANLGAFSQMVDVLCRLNREIGVLQKQRDDSRRTLGPAYDATRIKDTDQMNALEHERFYSDPPADSTLAKPAVKPALPPIPTSSFLADADEEAAQRKQLAHQQRFLETLRAFSGKNAPAPNANPLPPPPREAVSAAS